MTERNTRIRYSQIASVRPDDLDATNGLTDTYIPSYDQATGKFTWVAQSAGGAGSEGYTTSFDNNDLSSAGILIVNHNLNSTYPLVIIYDNNNLVIEPDEIEYKTANQIEIDLSSFAPISGTWHIRVNSGGSSVSNIEDLGDVDFDSGTPTDGQALIYDSGSSKWKAQDVPGGDELKDADNDTKIQVEESADEDKIRFDIAGAEQFIIEDGVILPTTDNDIDLGSSSKKFKDGYFAGKLTVDGLIDPTGIVLNSQAINPMGSGQEGIWIDSNDSKLYHFDGTDSKEILNSDHTDTYNHTNIHEQNKDTYLAFGTVDQVSAGDVKDAVDKKHSQNTDTSLDSGGANETSASELRTALDTTISGKADKISEGVEDNFVSIDNVGNIKDSGHKHSDYALSGHNHDTEYLALDNITPFTPDADYEPATKKYVDDALVGGGFGDMFKSTYDTNDNGIVDYAEAVDDGTSGEVNRSTASEIRGAVDDSHTHSNKALLDIYDQTNADLSDAVDKKHDRQHAIDSTSDHTSSITQNNLIDADANGLPNDSGLAVADVSDAVIKKHAQNTDTGTNQDTFSIGNGTEGAHKLIEANIGQSGTQPGIRYNKDTDTWQISNDGSTWNDIEAGTGSGDMLKSTYDTDEDGIVDKAESIDDGVGNSATASEIKGAVDDSHIHSNKALLDTYTQIEVDLADAVTKKHTRQHAIDSSADHTSSITENNLINADANGLPDDSGLAVSDVSDAVTKKHSQNTDVGTDSDDFAIGDGTDTDKTITVDNGDVNEPKIKYDSALNKWRYSNDGSTFLDIGSGGSLTVKEVDGNPTINNVSEIQIDQDSGLVLTELSGGIAKISIGSHWKNLVVDGQSTLIPDGVESLEFEAGSGIDITTNSGTMPKKITIAVSGSANSYRTSFNNGDLSSGILTVTHNLSQQYVFVQIYNNNEKMIIPDDIELKTTNSLEIDLSGFGTISGTWHVIVVA